MAAFWMVSGLMTALAAVLVLWRARQGSIVMAASEPIEPRELAELDRLRERGLLDADTHAEARAEAARRLIRAAPRPEASPGPPSDRRWVLAGVAFAAAAAAAVYALTGSPGTADEPHARRVDRWETTVETLDPPRLAAVAARAAERRPNDAQAQAFLGRARLEAGDPIGAASAFRRALAIGPETAELWGRLGEALILAGEGRVGADAEAAFNRALALDPAAQPPRYFLGQAALDRGDRARAAELWGPLIAGLPETDPRRAPLLEALAEAEAQEGEGA